MNYIGIDLAERTSAICVLDERGEVVTRAQCASDGEALVAWLRGYAPGRVFVEATPLAEWAAERAEQAGCEAVIIDARAARHVVRSSKKTDARDAHTLARLGHGGWYVQVHRKSASARVLRSQLQARQGLVRQRRAMGSQIRGQLKAHGVRVGAVSEGAFAARVRALVRAHVPELEAAIEELLGAWQRAREGAERLRREIERGEHLEPEHREAVDQLSSVYGVGVLVSRAYVATLDNPWRFERGEAVADYVGLTPRVYQSGQIEHRGRISKEGDELLRWHLVEAANSLLHHGRDCALKRWALGLRQRKGEAKAKVALARKLAMLLWWLWIRGERFDPQRGLRAAS